MTEVVAHHGQLRRSSAEGAKRCASGVAGQAQGGTRESAVLQYDNCGLNLAAAYCNGHGTNPSPTSAPQCTLLV